MATQIATVRAAWETQIKAAISGANVSGWFNDGEKYPRIQLVEDTTDSVQIVSDFGVAYATLRYIIVVEEGGTDVLSAAKRLDQWVSWDDGNSIYAALNADRTLGGVLKDMDVAQTWSVIPEQLRAELPVTFHVVKS